MSNWNGSLDGYRGGGGKLMLTNAELKDIPNYRPSSWKWGVPYEEWRDDAACNGSDPKLFELDKPVRQMSNEEQDETHELIAQGLRICTGCPVRSSCKLNSTDSDRYWTVRGGQPPEGLFYDAIAPRFATGASKPVLGYRMVNVPKRKLKERCKEGHEDWKLKKDGRRFCGTCAVERDKKRWKKWQ